MAAGTTTREGHGTHVSLDLAAIPLTAKDLPAEYPEPIPWKGTVGVVGAIDRDTSWTPETRPATARKSEAPRVESGVAAKAGSCGSSCGCAGAGKRAAGPEAPLTAAAPSKPAKDVEKMRAASTARMEALGDVLGIAAPSEPSTPGASAKGG